MLMDKDKIDKLNKGDLLLYKDALMLGIYSNMGGNKLYKGNKHYTEVLEEEYKYVVNRLHDLEVCE